MFHLLFFPLLFPSLSFSSSKPSSRHPSQPLQSLHRATRTPPSSPALRNPLLPLSLWNQLSSLLWSVPLHNKNHLQYYRACVHVGIIRRLVFLCWFEIIVHRLVPKPSHHPDFTAGKSSEREGFNRSNLELRLSKFSLIPRPGNKAKLKLEWKLWVQGYTSTFLTMWFKKW